jgi:hypothetical protein
MAMNFRAVLLYVFDAAIIGIKAAPATFENINSLVDLFTRPSRFEIPLARDYSS